MSRRFQFSLRALLVATALGCLALGMWQIYSMHFATYVASDSTSVGDLIRVNGRFYLKNGPDSTDFDIGVVPLSEKLQPMKATRCRAVRGRFGLYHFSEPAMCAGQHRWAEAGDFCVILYLRDGRYVEGRVAVKP